MYSGQSIDQHGHIVAVVVPCALVLADRILVDDLQTVIVDMVLVQQLDVLGTAIIPPEDLDMVLLKTAGLFDDAIRGGCDTVGEEPLPLGIAESVAVQFFQLVPQVLDKLLLRMDRKVLIALLAEKLDKLFLQFCFALIGFRTPFRRFIFCDHGVFTRGRNDAEKAHGFSSLNDNSLSR